HYRSQLNFDEADISQAEEVLDKLRSIYNQFSSLRGSSVAPSQETDSDVDRLSTAARDRFNSAMDDDFNTPRALAELIGFSKAAEYYATSKTPSASVERIVNTFDYFGNVFGILQTTNARQSAVVERLLNLLVQMREEARKRGDWTTADRIRSDLAQAGVGLEDTASGARWYIASTTKAVKKLG
ncbi:MAG TPA: DALR domain-containing protein, partial [Terriglobales bacterium]|nr:DALR domain-containing protein [Terriglobales bacterium]